MKFGWKQRFWLSSVLEYIWVFRVNVQKGCSIQVEADEGSHNSRSLQEKKIQAVYKSFNPHNDEDKKRQEKQ